MADDGLVTLTASEAAAEIAAGAVSAETYARACLARIEALDGEVKAFAHLDREHVLAQARALDERRMQGHPPGRLHGIPVAIKDIIDTADYPTDSVLRLPPDAAPARRHRCRQVMPPAWAVRRQRPSPPSSPISIPGRRATRTTTPARPAVIVGSAAAVPPIWCRSRWARRPTGR
jgi:hypothetical protein